jgi:hypothetical protein
LILVKIKIKKNIFDKKTRIPGNGPGIMSISFSRHPRVAGGVCRYEDRPVLFFGSMSPGGEGIVRGGPIPLSATKTRMY